MSQEKVDRYKQEKANRKKIMKKREGRERCPQMCRGTGRTSSCRLGWVFCLRDI